MQRGDIALFGAVHDQRTVAIEPEYLKTVAGWVERGGVIVFAPSRADESEPSYRKSLPDDGNFLSDLTAVEAMGLPGVRFGAVDLSQGTETPGDIRETWRTRGEDTLRSRLMTRRLLGTKRDVPGAYSKVRVTADGTLAWLRGQVMNLHVPAEGLRVVDPESEPAPVGRVIYVDGMGAEHTLVAVFRLGAGTIAVVADSDLFLNGSIARADNAILAVNLLAASGRTVVLDEFYHGLTIRGNPAWLLTRHPYGLVTLLLLLATLLWLWRARTVLGPPIPPPEKHRRSVVEYVEAMARLFHRSGHRKFILEEVRNGVLWALRRKCHLPHGVEDPSRIAAALERRDPGAASRFRRAVETTALLLQERGEPATDAMARSARELCSCL